MTAPPSSASSSPSSASSRSASPSARRYLRPAILAALVLVLAACPLWGGDGARSTLIVFAYHAAFAQMWNLLAGYAGLVTFGHQLFIGLGCYGLAVACERFGFGVWPAFACTAVLCAALAVPVGALTFRLKGGYFAVGSWLVAELCRLLFGNWDFVGNASGMFIRPARSVDGWVIYYVAIALLLAFITIIVALLRSRTGLALMAVRDAEDAAAGLGVHVWRLKLLAFVIAAGGAGLVGALITVQTPFIQPNAVFSIESSAQVSFMVVVGGLGTVEGSNGAVHLIVLGAISVIVMLTAPRGIAGVLRDRLGWTLFPIARKPPRA
jgi:branched-chain amino acid transport system permease protein